MNNRAWLDSLLDLVQREIRHLLALNPTDRRWELPLAAALSSGIPLLVGAAFGQMAYGLISSLGGLVFLYTPNSALPHRMGMTACFAVGLVGAWHPLLLVPLVTVLTMGVTVVCRSYRVNPPGSLFFVMAAAIAASMPFEVMAIPFRVGLLVMGCMVATGIAWVLLSTPMNVWQMSATMIALSFVIEFLVVRHYGLAIIFITPLTLFLADAGAGMTAPVNALIAARFWDIALGSSIGLLGGFFIHHPKSRAGVLRVLRPLWPG